MFELLKFWQAGDVITRSVAMILLFMSLVSWTIILSKAWSTWRLSRLDENIFWLKDSFEHSLDSLGMQTDNPFRELALTALDAAEPNSTIHSQLQRRLPSADWIARNLKARVDYLIKNREYGLAWLASIGATAPFIGLFGTVWGIYHALINMSVNSNTTIDKVAGPVGEALIMTALGLAVAIPAVLGYNALTRVNKNILLRLQRFALDLQAYFSAEEIHQS